MDDVEELIRAEFNSVPEDARHDATIYLRAAEYETLKQSTSSAVIAKSDEVLTWRYDDNGKSHYLYVKSVDQQKYPVSIGYWLDRRNGLSDFTRRL